jgi:hypothetical protein
MIRLPMLNVDSWFLALVTAMMGGTESAAPNALCVVSRAEDVFGAVIARDDGSARSNQSV